MLPLIIQHSLPILPSFRAVTRREYPRVSPDAPCSVQAVLLEPPSCLAMTRPAFDGWTVASRSHE